jgi:pilus assembly protein TadC
MIPKAIVDDYDTMLKYAMIPIKGESLVIALILVFILSMIIGIFLAANDFGDLIKNIRSDLNINIKIFSLGIFYGLILFFIIYGLVRGYIFYKIDVIKNQVESVLPDFLLSLSANLRAGMVLDQAITNAARPELGVLSNKINERMKEVYSGVPVEKALLRLSNDFDSSLFRRVIRIIAEGVKSGASLADVIDKLAMDIRDIRNYRDQVKASLSSYKTFILIAVVIGMPVLYAISLKMIDVFYKVFSEIKDLNFDVYKTYTPVIVNFTAPKLGKVVFLYYAISMIMISVLLTSRLLASIENQRSEFYIKFFFNSILAFTVFYLTSYMIEILFRSLNI